MTEDPDVEIWRRASGHPAFEPPENPDVKIWRYTSLPKLISMIYNRSLFFTRADKFEDKFEGSYSRANIKLRPQVYEGKLSERHLAMFSESTKQNLKFTVINCWHINENESAAMWKLYCSDKEGIAIQSTYNRLITSFSNNPDEIIFVGKVQYINYSTDWLPEGNIFYPFMHKRKSFEHERELRAIIHETPLTSDGAIDYSKEVFGYGKSVSVNLDNLIENIYVAPHSRSWFIEVVKEIVKKFDLEKRVIISDLSKDPVF